MKRILSFVVLLLMLTGGTVCAQSEDIYYTERTETVMLKSKYFNFERKVFIKLPSTYDYWDAEDFDVVYVFDAQTTEYLDMASSMPLFANTNWSNHFIFVGVCSPQTKEYSRRDDFIASDSASIKYNHGHVGHCDDLAMFVKTELMPYINSHYRTTDHTLGIGHSLGASFLMESMANHELFNDYIAMSPNFAYGNNHVAKDFIHHDFSKTTTPKYLFLSDAAEERIPHWEYWKPAREMVYNFIRHDSLPKNVTCVIKSYPAYDHMSCFPSALHDAYIPYFQYRDSIDDKPLSETWGQSETFRKRIELVVHNAKDEVYITGNQDGLGNWNPGKIKMTHVNDTLRAIDVDLQLPTHFKFTRGSWDSEAFLKNSHSGTNLNIDNKERRVYHFVLDSWSDE